MRYSNRQRHDLRRPQAGWHPRQVTVVHIYVSLSDITDPEYREMLRSHTFLEWGQGGAITSKDPRLTQLDFDRFMPQLEALLWSRVDAGLATPPTGKYGKRDYWANHCGALGAMSTRQRHAIYGLWYDLRNRLSLADTWDYVNGIARHATGGILTDWQAADSSQANALIAALKDRLAHAPPAPAVIPSLPSSVLPSVPSVSGGVPSPNAD